jgi:hypothetical protein
LHNNIKKEKKAETAARRRHDGELAAVNTAPSRMSKEVLTIRIMPPLLLWRPVRIY